VEDSIQSRDNLTPMLRQYFEAKAAYPDAVLFFRLGDFYEMFFDDALEVSRLLELTLTHRNKTAEGEPIPMCGVPYHAAEGYVKRLVEAGRKVAVCDQVEDPRLAKGIVRREVRLVVTPGVRLDVDSLDAARNNYLLAVNPVEGGRLALAFVDVSTGLMRCALAVDLETAEREWVRVEPSEVLLPEGAADTRARVEARLPGVAVTLAPLAAFADQPVDGIEALGEPFQPGQWGVVSALAWFLDRMNPGARAVLTRAEGYAPGNALALDANARRNLELFETLFERRRKGSLLGSMDRTQTAMGARLLRDWLAAPLMSLQAISARQDAVQEMLERRSDRERLRALIDRTPDLDRMSVV
jgi:DNA mismatch repair protein MutS